MSEASASSSIPPHTETRFKGVAASPGIAFGPCVFLEQDKLAVRKRKIKAEDIPSEINRLEQALVKTRHQIQEIKNHLASSLGERDANIFEAHMLVVEDSTIIEAVKAQLYEKLICVEYLYQQITNSFSQQMLKLEDEYLREKAHDILDVSRRVLKNLLGHTATHTASLDNPSIVLSHDLSPSDTAMLDRKKVLGFATEVGSRTSHSAIMARSLNIPAVVGLRDALSKIEAGVEVLIDGYEGLLVLHPTEQTKFEYGQIEIRRMAVEEKLDEIRETLAITLDQRRVTVSANVELPEDLAMVQENGAEGIGLYRTEFLYFNRLDLPNEEEQTALYRQVATAAKPHSIIIRTLDVGGDKMLPNLAIEAELNPFLGWRGIRMSLDRADLFKTQLRAIVRASIEGNVRVMFPMITDLQEVRRARQLLREVQEELRNENVPQADKIECGIMIEVPSAALTADSLAKEVDFFSIGTNDLVQYTMAVDRVNEKVAALYQPTHPAVLRLIQMVVDAAHRHNIWVGVCGEMAGDLLLTPLLVGLGVDELSLGSVYVPRIKRAIQSVSYQDVRLLAEQCLAQASAEENLKTLEDLAKRLYPDLL